YLITLKCHFLQRKNPRRLRSLRITDQQSGFGETVASVERLASKTATAKYVSEALECRRQHGAGADARPGPIAQGELFALFGRDLGSAQLVGESGSTTRHVPVAGDRAQPA